MKKVKIKFGNLIYIFHFILKIDEFNETYLIFM